MQKYFKRLFGILSLMICRWILNPIKKLSSLSDKDVIIICNPNKNIQNIVSNQLIKNHIISERIIKYHPFSQ